jgi:hypothetical protein
VDGRADLFSLGCVLYEMLAGSPAFEGDDERSLLFQVLQQGPIALGERAPEVPEPLAHVVQRALARSPDARFGSAEEMRQALCACVPTRSAFELERRSTEVMGSVLGERVRQREEQMRLTFQRFATAQLEHTDTLPIGNAIRRREGTTLHSGGVEVPLSSRREAPVSIPGGVALAAPPQSRRARWLVTAALAVSLAAYLAWSQRVRPGAPLEAALPEAAPGPPSAAPGELQREQQGLLPGPTAPQPAAPVTSPPAASPPSTGAPPTASPESATSVPAPRRPNRKRAPDATQPAERSVPAGRKWKLPGNPYKDVPTPSSLKSSPTR